MDEKINPNDLYLENERLRKELHSLTQAQNDNLIHKQQLDAILDNAPVEIYLKDREARYIKINKQFEKIFDVKNEDVKGLLPADVHDSELATSSRNHDLSVLNSGKVERREQMSKVAGDRQLHTLLTIKFPVFNGDGEVDGLGAIVTDITDEVATRVKLWERNALFSQAESMGNMGHFYWDLTKDKLISCSDQFARIYGMTVPEALECFVNIDALIDLIHPDDKERFRQGTSFYKELHNGNDIEYRVTLSGNTRHLYVRREILLDNNGEPLQVFGIVQDITAEKEKEFALIQATESTQAVNRELAFQKHALDEHAIVSIADVAGDITYVNDKFCSISGYDREELIGNNHKIVKSDEHPDEFFVDMWKAISSGHTWHGEIKNANKTGNVYWVKTTIVPTLDDKGKPFQYVGIRTDITADKNNEKKLKLTAHYDALTNLPNRVLLADRLNHAMVQCQRRNRSLAVMFMDIDGFKAVNDTYGHDLGDKLLVELSRRMKEALRESDTLARIGGDEFIAVMVDLEKIEDSEPILKRLLKVAAKPVTLGDAVMQVSASIGVTFYPQDGADADQLMRHADQAMYIAKQSGKNSYQLFDTAQDSAVNIQQQSIGDVRSALSRRELVLHYQPKVNMHTGGVIGVEALIRWQHPDRGLVPPLEFLPAIEGHAISLELGEWVIDTALTQIDQWRSMGVELPISVNISAYQLQQDNFVTRLEGLLATYPEVDPHYLELEILESSVLSDISQVFDTMNACHELGVRFALDDFGTGYSSLTHIKRLPAYLIKIDQSFVRDMLEDIDDLAIVESVIGLAKAFKREVIAEGVETIAHGVALLELGCELAQGYGIARPMTADDIPEWISSWKADDSWQTHLQIVSDTVHEGVKQTV
jgi:diguanylate cyclase (GGDEF)-like protein/PAS domain S-box-containing protein